uniref:Uncharacterized protein n=1 Tax=Proboscia inermis TaxID=420281 RepID=A0A7S0G848_9STRA
MKLQTEQNMCKKKDEMINLLSQRLEMMELDLRGLRSTQETLLNANNAPTNMPDSNCLQQQHNRNLENTVMNPSNSTQHDISNNKQQHTKNIETNQSDFVIYDQDNVEIITQKHSVHVQQRLPNMKQHVNGNNLSPKRNNQQFFQGQKLVKSNDRRFLC